MAKLCRFLGVSFAQLLHIGNHKSAIQHTLSVVRIHQVHGQLGTHGRCNVYYLSRVGILKAHIQFLCISSAKGIIIRFGIAKPRFAFAVFFFYSKCKFVVAHIRKNSTCLAFQQHHFALPAVQCFRHFHKSAVFGVVGHHAGHARGV